jgi:intein-encoded DNA endonuclease-like protein
MNPYSERRPFSMTNEQKEKIAELRSTGVSYAKIGEALGLQQRYRKNILPEK